MGHCFFDCNWENVASSQSARKGTSGYTAPEKGRAAMVQSHPLRRAAHQRNTETGDGVEIQSVDRI